MQTIMSARGQEDEGEEQNGDYDAPREMRRRPVPVALLGYLIKILGTHIRANLRIVAREVDIFVGTAFFVVGMLGIESDKYCDGNTADYLSCTRPSTYYYYSWFDITLVILGIFLIIIWFLKKRRG